MYIGVPLSWGNYRIGVFHFRVEGLGFGSRVEGTRDIVFFECSTDVTGLLRRERFV